MNRKASPETIAAIRKLRAGLSLKATYEALGTTQFTYMRIVDGLPVHGYVLDGIEERLAAINGKPYEPPPSLVGTRHGKLLITGEAGRVGKSQSMSVHVRCDCGTERVMRVASIQRGARSCGCPLERSSAQACVSITNGRVMYEAFGRKQGLEAWSAEYGIPIKTLRSRVHQQGRTLEQALTMAKVLRGNFAGNRVAS